MISERLAARLMAAGETVLTSQFGKPDPDDPLDVEIHTEYHLDLRPKVMCDNPKHPCYMDFMECLQGHNCVTCLGRFE